MAPSNINRPDDFEPVVTIPNDMNRPDVFDAKAISATANTTHSSHTNTLVGRDVFGIGAQSSGFAQKAKAGFEKAGAAITALPLWAKIFIIIGVLLLVAAGVTGLAIYLRRRKRNKEQIEYSYSENWPRDGYGNYGGGYGGGYGGEC